MSLVIGRVFADVQFQTKVKLDLSLEPFGIVKKILHTHSHPRYTLILKIYRQRDCQMSFIIYAKVQILKKIK